MRLRKPRLLAAQLVLQATSQDDTTTTRVSAPVWELVQQLARAASAQARERAMVLASAQAMPPPLALSHLRVNELLVSASTVRDTDSWPTLTCAGDAEKLTGHVLGNPTMIARGQEKKVSAEKD